jgi:hypothetical protein
MQWREIILLAKALLVGLEDTVVAFRSHPLQELRAVLSGEDALQTIHFVVPKEYRNVAIARLPFRVTDAHVGLVQEML